MKALMWIAIILVVEIGGFVLVARFNRWHRERVTKKKREQSA